MYCNAKIRRLHPQFIQVDVKFLQLSGPVVDSSKGPGKCLNNIQKKRVARMILGNTSVEKARPP